MAATATAKGPSSPEERLPPDEQFWERYSPHGEMPISTVASVALHGLVLGGLLLFGAYLTSVLFKSDRPLPVEPVRLDASGGGGGSKTGSGDQEGVGVGPEDTGEGEKADLPQKGKLEAPARPSLSIPERRQREKEFVPEDARYLAQNDTDAARAYTRLGDAARRKLTDGLNPGKGQGGSGKGGGKGTGSGTGEGDSKGPGKQRATLSQREKRMLRWNMRFPANSGREYLTQLNALGAILAIPVREGGGETQYKVVRNLLARPAPLLDEDVTKLNRIFWIDDKPESVQDVMTELRVPFRPNRFVAFMPMDLEDRLYKMEQAHMKRTHGKFVESRIYETRFRVNLALPGKVELVQMTLKGPGQR